MRKVLFIAVLVLVCGCFAAAQDYPKGEVFGGFSMIHVDTEGATNASAAAFTDIAGTTIKTWYPGWEVSGQYNLTKMFGIKADFAGNYGKPLTVPGFSTPGAHGYTFLFGPVVSFRRDRITPFVHALFGGNHITLDADAALGSPSFSETAFAMAFGGGVDVKLTHHFSARLGQFDYLYTKHCINAPEDVLGFENPAGCLLGSNSIFGAGAPAAHQNNFRFSTGIVIH